MRKLVAILALAFFISLPVFTRAAFSTDESGLGETGGAAYGADYIANDSIADFIGYRIIQPVLGIMGLLFLVLMIYAGVLWMTAQGDPKDVQKAKDIIRSAIIGVVIVVAAYALTTAVFNALTTGSLTGGATVEEGRVTAADGG
jgi:uncharacterized membrane protein